MLDGSLGSTQYRTDSNASLAYINYAHITLDIDRDYYTKHFENKVNVGPRRLACIQVYGHRVIGTK